MRQSSLLRRFALPVLFLFVAAVTWADLSGGEDLLIQRRYQEAAVALEKALPELPVAERARGRFLLGHARLLAGDTAGAISAFQQVQKEHKGSPQEAQSRFLEAEASQRAGDLRGAAQIYRGEVERLVGLSRKADVAATYLGLADKALASDPPKHDGAVVFLDLALDLGLPAVKARAVRLQAAESLLAIGKHGDAITRLRPLVAELDVGAGKPRAMLALGRALRLLGDRPACRSVCRDLRALVPAAAEAGDAAYEIALSYNVPQPAPGELDRATAALDELARSHPSHSKAKIADYLAAQCYVHVGRGDEGLAAIGRFLKAHGDGTLPEVAESRAMVGDVLLQQRKPKEAIAAWREYLSRHPSHGAWERVQRAIVDAEFGIAAAEHADGKEQFGKARELFAAFATTYPLDERNPDILYRLGDMLLQEAKHDEAREAFARCVSKYPGKEPSSHSQFEIGRIYEQKTFNYEAALTAYRAVAGEWQGHAQQALARLTQKHLLLQTERIFRTDEKAVFSLTSRNIEKVRVRVYRLELEDYFRATHTTGDIHRLDIEVIAADKTFDSAVPDYLKYRETARDVEIGFAAPGAYVVKVDDQELEATTMVLVSDIALIAKSNRHEFFVFTQNTKEQRAQAGVKVVLSDGSKVLGEGVTGADGVYRWKGPELQQRDGLVVFAVDGAGSGGSSLQLSGLGFSAGLTAKGFLYTDRPLYLPGQRVFSKGIVREVAAGVYRLPEASGYRLRAFSPSGRLLQDRSVLFTAFGSFASELDLPADAEVGDWRLTVERQGTGALVFHGTFEVAQYERPRLSLGIEIEQPVVFRGEAIRGRAIARHFYGEPAAGKPIEVTLQLPDGQKLSQAGVTNAAGELPFTFATTEFAEEAFAGVTAVLPGENVTTSVGVPVVTTELTASVRTVRPLYLAGETFAVEGEIKDRSGKPAAREATVVLSQLDCPSKQHRGQLVEVEVARQPLRTGADGKGQCTFTAQKGGNHRIRIEVTDRFRTVVTGEAMVAISGDDDEQKLRLLGDRDTYRVGENAAVKVMNRAGKGLALLTWQGDGILAYETRLLPAGESTLSLSIQTLHAPNFALAIAVIDGKALRTAEREFRVERDLRLAVSLTPLARPGAEVEVMVQANDAEGRPVAAEVSLALVDEALLTVRGDRTAPIGAFFYGELRDTVFPTVSSCTWSYRGPSRRASEALLAEERRVLHETERAATEPGSDQNVGRTVFYSGEAGRGPTTGVQTVDLKGFSQGTGNLRTAFGLTAQRAGQQQLEQQDAGGISVVRRMRSLGEDDQPALFLERRYGAFYKELGTNGWGIALPQSNEPRTDFRETGAWISSLVTGKDGRATAKIKLPQAMTSWRLKGHATTVDTQVGECSATVKTQQELQVDLIGPPVLTEGDETVVRLAAHNLTGDPVDVKLSWTSKGAMAGTGSAESRLLAHAETEHGIPILAGTVADLELALLGTAGTHRDEIARKIRVVPFGVEMRAGRSGATTDRASFELSLPEGREYSSLQLLVELGHDPGRDLIAAALGVGYLPQNCRHAALTNLARSSQGLAALVVLGHLERTGAGSKVDHARLLGMAEANLAGIAGRQLPDGSYAWVGKQNQDLRSTCQIVRFLAMCKQRGLAGAGESLDKAAEWLLVALRTASTEARADLLWALAACDKSRFESLNSLQRSRTGLSPDGLARLCLAWHASKRPEGATEVLDTLRTKVTAATFAKLPAETMALVTQALLATDRRDPLGTVVLAALQQARVGAAWDTFEATAAALAAVTQAQQAGAGTPRATKVTAKCNGVELREPVGDAAELATLFAVPAEHRKATGNRIELLVEGGGEVHYRVNLVGFGRGFLPDDRNSERIRVTRDYLAAPLRHDGRVVNSGFSVVDGKNVDRFENKTTQLREGESCMVRTTFSLRREDDQRTMTPLVVEEPLPAGCSVPRASIAGNFDHVDVQPDRLVFFFREGISSSTIRYELQARFAGNYRTLPTLVQSALRPEFLGYGEPGKLRVHARGAGEADAYRLTPDEHFHLGSQWYAKGETQVAEQRAASFGKAYEHLQQLLDGWHKKEHFLRDQTFREVARMLLFLGIERSDARTVVRFFEELKDRFADLVIPFDKIVAVGKSYLDLGEFEAALLVFRATAEASFLKDAAVATVLEQHGEVRASAEFLERLLAAYPSLSTMRVARYSIGQKLAAVAAGIAPGAVTDERIGTAPRLRKHALAVLREFLILHPDDPMAEEVSFAWATTHVEDQNLQQALAVTQAALLRHPGSTFTDEFLYTLGYAQFALGKHDDAFAALRRVAEEQFARPGGGTGPSESQWHAVYLQGQIHHARGEPALALLAYDKVKDRFADAGEAADYFLQKQLSLPEVATFLLADAPSLTISYRNVQKASVQVFRVDLMRLYLMERSLQDIRGIQLHGIKPQLAFEVELGSGRDYRTIEKKVPLQLAEPGAYLVVLRAGEQIASGMVLRTDLRIEAQEQLDVGRIRVNCKQGEAFLADAHVKVNAAGDTRIRSGSSDLRGVYVGDDLVGPATVIVKKGEQYAFYRGTGVHQPGRFQPPPSGPATGGPGQQQQRKAGKAAQGFDALENNINFNSGNRARQVEWLKDNVLNKDQKGVEVYRTK